MTAAVGGVVDPGGIGMAQCRKGIQFSDQADTGRTGPDRYLEGSAETQVSDFQAVGLKIVRQYLFIGEFLVAQFGMHEEFIAEFIQGFCVFFYRFIHRDTSFLHDTILMGN